MNYCDKIHYNIYTTGLATFGEMVDALLAQLPQDEQILRLAFFGMPNDNEQYVSRRIMLREKIRKFYGNHEPVLSYVSQPPLNAGLILEVHSYKADEDDHITFRRHGGFPYVVLENADGTPVDAADNYQQQGKFIQHNEPSFPCAFQSARLVCEKFKKLCGFFQKRIC